MQGARGRLFVDGWAARPSRCVRLAVATTVLGIAFLLSEGSALADSQVDGTASTTATPAAEITTPTTSPASGGTAPGGSHDIDRCGDRR